MINMDIISRTLIVFTSLAMLCCAPKGSESTLVEERHDSLDTFQDSTIHLSEGTEEITIANYVVEGPDETGGRMTYPKGDFQTFFHVVSEYTEIDPEEISDNVALVTHEIKEQGQTRTLTFRFDIKQISQAENNKTPLIIESASKAVLVPDGITIEKTDEGKIAIWYGGYIFE